MSEVESMLNTNVVSYLMKGGQMAEMYNPFVQGQLLSISFITVGELYFGAEKAGWGEKRRRELEAPVSLPRSFQFEFNRTCDTIVCHRERPKETPADKGTMHLSSRS